MTDQADPIPRVTAADPASSSGSVVADNVAALKRLFPAMLTDGKVDFDVLRQLFGDEVEDGEERYGLTWKGKRQARAFALTPSLGTLRPAKEESVDWETTANIFVEGENLEVLKILTKSYAGRVKFIYIDPPYNTGGDFIYPDNYKDTIGNYERITAQRNSENVLVTSDREAAGRLHSDWLTMIYPRLMLAKSLLSDQGVIAISIDDREYNNLLTICREIYGEENILGNVIWRNATDNNPTHVAVEHEYILIIARNKDELPNEWKSSGSAVKDILISVGQELAGKHDDENLQEAYNRWYREHKAELWPLDRYKYIDQDGVYTGSQSVHNPGREGYRYDVLHPVTKRPTKQPLMGYRFPKSTMDDLLESGRILFGEDENKIVELKVYAKDYEGKLPSWLEIDGRLGAYDLKEDFPEATRVFSNPKPVSLIALILSYVSRDEDDIVMDFFAGSGTTARAVLSQGGLQPRRRFLLVQLPEPLDSRAASQRSAADFCDKIGKPRTIAELTKERLRRVSAQVRKEYPGANIDTGFRVYKLASSNLKPWQPDPDNLGASLFDAIDNILPGRTEDDLLIELLLKTGIDLTLPSERRAIAGATVHALGGGVLMVCLADIAENQAEALGQGICDWRAELDPPRATTFYFKDSGFASAATKANLAAIVRQRVGDGVEKLASL